MMLGAQLEGKTFGGQGWVMVIKTHFQSPHSPMFGAIGVLNLLAIFI